MSKTIEHSGFLLVEVPEKSYGHRLYELNDGWNIECWYNGYLKYIQIDGGNYQIIGLAKDLSEDQWKEIAEEMYLGERPTGKYENYGFGLPKFETATESGHSLLKSHSLEPSTTLILKKL